MVVREQMGVAELLDAWAYARHGADVATEFQLGKTTPTRTPATLSASATDNVHHR